MTNAGGDDGEPIYHEFSTEKNNLLMQEQKPQPQTQPQSLNNSISANATNNKPRKISAGIHFNPIKAINPKANANAKTLEVVSSAVESAS